MLAAPKGALTEGQLPPRGAVRLEPGRSGRAAQATEVVCPQIVQMSNYCGIGIDAELSLDFHQAREEEPSKFTSRCPG